MLLKDRVAIVTGGAKGMGKAISLKFAEEGCAVVVDDVSLQGARKVAEEITGAGGRALAVRGDITKSAEVRDMVDQAVREFGKIDILVNNAGGVPGTKGGGNTDSVTEEEWDRIIDLNLKGHFLVSMAVIPHMKKNKYGKIICISSMGAVSPSVSVLHYHAAKAGLMGLALNLAFELAPQNIFVNVIVPGPIETPFWDSLMPPGPKRDAFLTALAKQEIPLGRMGTPKDIAGPALFLASELSDYMTGQVLCVAGGQPMSAQAATFNIEEYLKKSGG
jgi:NAD(P)-dependent dehydrogenase (short-subunit alcohol dehydrogenase family)